MQRIPSCELSWHGGPLWKPGPHGDLGSMGRSVIPILGTTPRKNGATAPRRPGSDLGAGTSCWASSLAHRLQRLDNLRVLTELRFWGSRPCRAKAGAGLCSPGPGRRGMNWGGDRKTSIRSWSLGMLPHVAMLISGICGRTTAASVNMLTSQQHVSASRHWATHL